MSPSTSTYSKIIMHCENIYIFCCVDEGQDKKNDMLINFYVYQQKLAGIHKPHVYNIIAIYHSGCKHAHLEQTIIHIACESLSHFGI